jgi:tetratricopeptide (TPR) repeat protein
MKNEHDDPRARLKLADEHLRRGETDAAVDVYQSVAKGFLREGFSLKALAVYKSILAITPQRLETYFATAAICCELGLWSAARDHLVELTRRIKERHGAALVQAATYRQAGPLDVALEQLAALAAELERGTVERGQIEMLRRALAPFTG